MANHKRKRPRTAASGNRPKTMSSWPAWWDIIFHRRPTRAKNHALERAVEKGEDPDELEWPLKNNKPHKYYW